jgi:hypothetical protein
VVERLRRADESAQDRLHCTPIDGDELPIKRHGRSLDAR